MDPQKRLTLISKHLLSRFPEIPISDTLTSYRKKTSFDSSSLRNLIYGGRSSIVEEMISYMMESQSLFDHYKETHLSIPEYRELILRQILATYGKILSNPSYNKDDINHIMAVLHGMNLYSQSFAARLMVHLILCFGMTELGHGTNVAALETTAVYDHKTRGFILNSPTSTSAKWWIGAMGKTADMAVIFAQLFVEGVNRGVHAFAVRIRNKTTHDPMPGVTVGDCGMKNGLNGIDNGFILFKDYFVPYDALLDRISHISNEGKFKSIIKNNEKRLGIMLLSLMGGRISCIGSTSISMHLSLTIAIRFSATRKQFSSTGVKDTESAVIEYQTQKYRIFPHLAKFFVFISSYHKVKSWALSLKQKILNDPENEEITEIHAILASMKPVGTWYANETIQACREACGGLAYSVYSQFARIRNDQDIQVTWEGDNHVLLQQTARFILKQFQKYFKGIRITVPTLSFMIPDSEKLKELKGSFSSLEDLENIDCLVSMLEYKFNYLLHEAIARIKENAGKYSEISQTWNNSQIFYLQELPKAYIEIFMINTLIEDQEKLDNSETKEMIKWFIQLYALEKIRKDLEIYMVRYLSYEQGKLIKDKIFELCDKIGNFAVDLIDAIAPPDFILSSILAMSDGQIYKHIISTIEKSPETYEKASFLKTINEMRTLAK
ncbi:unnamed protein product [Blepharisma stoltei]|uniref:Acyl-coenzyme A oxidase n=1 Tax=Blepharisma stoltei TaxID=1481888 RepID=A0AAU9JM84_9CILI|nr:unnamed protein product [Blepharisma stoltei]